MLVGETGERGIVGNLTLELLDDGNGDFYPSPELCLRLDDDFLVSAAAAQAYVSREGLCREAHDVRWTLERRDGRALGPRVSGGSAGALLALGLGKILIAD